VENLGTTRRLQRSAIVTLDSDSEDEWTDEEKPIFGHPAYAGDLNSFSSEDFRMQKADIETNLIVGTPEIRRPSGVDFAVSEQTVPEADQDSKYSLATHDTFLYYRGNTRVFGWMNNFLSKLPGTHIRKTYNSDPFATPRILGPATKSGVKFFRITRSHEYNGNKILTKDIMEERFLLKSLTTTGRSVQDPLKMAGLGLCRRGPIFTEMFKIMYANPDLKNYSTLDRGGNGILSCLKYYRGQVEKLCPGNTWSTTEELAEIYENTITRFHNLMVLRETIDQSQVGPNSVPVFDFKGASQRLQRPAHHSA
jgi:hypothetical protein